MKTKDKKKEVVLSNNNKITTSEQLAQMMAKSAHELTEAVDKNISVNGIFKDRYKKYLDMESFSASYAQSIVYVVFSAKLSRTSYGSLLGHDSFISMFHEDIVNPNLPDYIRKPINKIVDVIKQTDLVDLFKDYADKAQGKDILMHFYEDFLCAYDPKLRKDKGVWYSPDEVVDFMVRSVDTILKKEFGKEKGVADENVKIHDPATGTGTFPAAIMKKMKENIGDREWEEYVNKNLTKNLSASEIMLASWTIARIKTKLLLRQLGYKGKKNIDIRLEDTLNPEWYKSKENRCKKHHTTNKNDKQEVLI